MGTLDGCPILASETCALDIIGAKYVRDVENGEVLVFDDDGAHSHKPFADGAAALHLRVHLFLAAGLHRRRPHVYDVRKAMGPSLRRNRRRRATSSCRCRIPACPPRWDIRKAPASPMNGHHPQPLRRPHLHRTDPAYPSAWRPPQAQRQPRGGRGQAHRAGGRLDRARHHLDQDRADDARRRRPGGAFPLSRRPPITHPDYYGIDTPERDKLLAATHDLEGMRKFIGADSLAFLSVEGIYKAMGFEARDPVRPQFTDHCFTGDYPTGLTDQTGQQGQPGNGRCSPRRAEALRARTPRALRACGPARPQTIWVSSLIKSSVKRHDKRINMLLSGT